MGEDGFEFGTLGLQDPVLVFGEFTIRGFNWDFLFEFKDFFDLIYTAQTVLAEFELKISDKTVAVERCFVFILEFLSVV